MSALTDRIATMILTGHTDTHIARTLNCHRATPNAVRHQLRRTGRYVTARLAAEAVPTGRTLRRQPTSEAEAAYHCAVLAAALAEPTQEDDDMDEPGFTLSHVTDQLERFEIARGVTMAALGWAQLHSGDRHPTHGFVWFEPGAEVPIDHHAHSSEVNVILRGELVHMGMLLGPDEVLTCARGTTHSPRSPEGGSGALVYVTFPDLQPRR